MAIDAESAMQGGREIGGKTDGEIPCAREEHDAIQLLTSAVDRVGMIRRLSQTIDS
jgi:hypothetical protein